MNEELLMDGIRQGEETLSHYGVLGMKWGVRKNPDKAAMKAVKKLRGYEKASDRKKMKADKVRVKSAKFEVKADKFERKALRTGSSRKFRKYTEKARKQKAKHYKRNLKAAKLDRAALKKSQKGKKWVKRMNKYLANQTYTNVSKDDIMYAKSWLVSVFD